MKKVSFVRVIFALMLGFCAFATQALTIEDYHPEIVKKAQAAGKPHALVFHAEWCPTCRAQAKVFNQLKAESKLTSITIYNVDFDGETELKKSLKVRGQSTVIVYKGGAEVARSVGDTNSEGLRQILSKSL